MRVPQDRALTPEERILVHWLLAHGRPPARAHLGGVEGLRVVSRCDCGCASIDFVDAPGEPLEVLADYQWQDADGHLFGAMVFAKDGKLAGLDVWSIDGAATPTTLPAPSVLAPLT